MKAHISTPAKSFWFSLYFLVLLVPSTLHATINNPATIHIGVLTTGTKEQCFQQWRPTAEYLNRALPGYAASIVCLEQNEVEKAVYNGLVDFTITNPAVYINLEYILGATRIATLKDKGNKETSTQYGSVLIKKADRKDIQTVVDLKGKRFAAVDKLSFGGWIMAWRYLKQHGIDPFKDFAALNFLGQHDSVVSAVQKGSADAGAIRTGTLEHLAEEGKIDLKDFEVIDQQKVDQATAYGITNAPETGQEFPYVHTTQLYPQWALAKVSHVDENLAAKVMFAFLQITPASKAALASHSQGWVIPLDYSPVLECLKELKIGPYKYLDTPFSLYQLYKQYRFWVHGFLGLLALILGGVFYILILNRKLSSTMARLAKEHQEKAKRTAELIEFKTTLDKTNDCVFIFDPETLSFLYTNQGGLDLTGYSREEILTMNPTDLLPDLTVPEYRTLIAPLLDKSKNSIESITTHKSKTGDLVPVEIVVQYVTLPDGKGRCVAIVRNISRRLAERKEREALQARLLSEQKLASVGQLAAGIAHEINTPTQYVGSNIDFLSESFNEINTLIDQYDQLVKSAEEAMSANALIDKLAELKNQSDWDYLKEEIPKAIEQSQEGLTKIRSIVLAMKEFSHPGSKEKQQTDLNRLIETTLTISGSLWKDVATIDRRLDEHLPALRCLPTEIGQVFLNIIVNAAHAITEKNTGRAENEKGCITITSRTLADQVEITFSDTGCGIPQNIRDKVFDPFFTTKGVGQGTGQGLTISYDAIVNKHGGTLDFTSTEGEGTSFIIRLPRDNVASSSSSQQR